MQGGPGYYYLTTPYTRLANRNRAWDQACRITARLIKLGYNVYCPIAENHPISKYLDPEDCDDTEFWIKYLKPKMVSSQGLIVVTMLGWRQSDGVAKEIATFALLKKPIYYLDPATYQFSDIPIN